MAEQIQFAKQVMLRYYAFKERDEEKEGPFSVIKNYRQQKELQVERLKQQRETVEKNLAKQQKNKVIVMRKVSEDSIQRKNFNQNIMRQQIPNKQQKIDLNQPQNIFFTQSLQYHQPQQTSQQISNQSIVNQLSLTHSLSQPQQIMQNMTQLYHPQYSAVLQQNQHCQQSQYDNEDSPIYIKGLPTTPQVKILSIKRMQEDEGEQFCLN